MTELRAHMPGRIWGAGGASWSPVHTLQSSVKPPATWEAALWRRKADDPGSRRHAVVKHDEMPIQGRRRAPSTQRTPAVNKPTPGGHEED